VSTDSPTSAVSAQTPPLLRSWPRRAVVHVRPRDTAPLEETLERLRDRPGITRTQTQIVLSTLFERPFRE
jgi:hypothetical protein